MPGVAPDPSNGVDGWSRTPELLPGGSGCEQPQLLLKLPLPAASEQAWLQYSVPSETGQVHFGCAH